MARRFLVSVRFDRYPRPDAFDRLSDIRFPPHSSSKGYTAILCLPTACGAMRAFPTSLVSRGNLRLFTLNKVAHHPGGTGLGSLRIERTTLFMKDFLTNPQPCISSVAPSPLVRQSHSDCEKAGSTSPR
jgi:hypothetical protein